MLWKGRKGSENIEDFRGKKSSKKIVGGGISAFIAGIIVYFFGANMSFFNKQQPATNTSNFPTSQRVAEAEDSAFVSVVLGETDDVWQQQFKKLHKKYRKPKVGLYDKSIESPCGVGTSASGPFYCPADEHVYIDLSFYKDLKERYSAPGDFAMAYVVAHEVGHHVQNLLGTTERIQGMRLQMNKTESNVLSVRMELQADFYAGVWAFYTQKKKLLETGDIEEALNAASAVGDDKLQQKTNSQLVPDAFTHGTSEQRMFWFKKGYDTGDIKQGDTLSASNL